MLPPAVHPPTPLAEALRSDIRAYYGRTLQSTADLRTSACCSTEDLPAHHRAILAQIEGEVLDRFYGCGSPLPPVLDGCTVLDLGCGTGRDAFLCAALVGEAGQVVGVDMTEEQLAVALRHEEAQAQRFGYAAPNTRFLLGTIEDLGALGIEDESVDVVVSNCVINLSPAKDAVLREAWRVLKPGGELYFADVFADRRVPAEAAADPVARGECLGGAMYWEDFRRTMADVGCPDVRVVSRRPVEVEDERLAALLGGIGFTSRTVRAFKLANLEDRCEDYGQVAIYRGGIEGHEHAIRLDDHHTFERDRPMLVCGNTAAMLQETRLARHFEIIGDRSRHFGLFDCAPAENTDGSAGSCC